jgi:hypothetical protein
MNGITNFRKLENISEKVTKICVAKVGSKPPMKTPAIMPISNFQMRFIFLNILLTFKTW